MARYRCDSCKEDRDDPICPKCGSDTREIDPLQKDAAALKRIVAPEPARTANPAPRTARKAVEHPAAARTAAAELKAQPAEAKPREVRRIEPVPQPPPQQPEPPKPVPAVVTHVVGLDQFTALLENQRTAVIVCGGGMTGKSEIVAGFIRAKNVYRGQAEVRNQRTVQTGYVLGGTNPDEVWFQVFGRDRVFLDPSGEFFKRLSLDYRKENQLPDLSEDDFRFVQGAAKALAGIILVFDLTRAVDAQDPAAWRRQENEFNFILAALRWMRWDKEARSPKLGYVVNISHRANLMPLLDKPVLILFSKADQLTKVTNENPLRFARRRLPVLHGALMTHARRFRYDFCHTMINEGGYDVETDYPCGVLLPIEWMLDERFARVPLQLPTRLLGGGK